MRDELLPKNHIRAIQKELAGFFLVLWIYVHENVWAPYILFFMYYILANTWSKSLMWKGMREKSNKRKCFMLFHKWNVLHVNKLGKKTKVLLTGWTRSRCLRQTTLVPPAAVRAWHWLHGSRTWNLTPEGTLPAMYLLATLTALWASATQPSVILSQLLFIFLDLPLISHLLPDHKVVSSVMDSSRGVFSTI